MKLPQLDHLIRAAGAISQSNEVLLVGSQAVLPQLAAVSATVTRSVEADFSAMPGDPRAAQIADLIDGAVGEMSVFNDTFGYYGQGVAPATARLPEGWQERAVRYETPTTNGVVACCPEKHDIAASKLIAGREKDLEFVTELAGLGELSMTTVIERLNAVRDIDETVRGLALSRAERIVGEQQSIRSPRSGLR